MFVIFAGKISRTFAMIIKCCDGDFGLSETLALLVRFIVYLFFICTCLHYRMYKSQVCRAVRKFTINTTLYFSINYQLLWTRSYNIRKAFAVVKLRLDAIFTHEMLIIFIKLSMTFTIPISIGRFSVLSVLSVSRCQHLC